MNNYFFFFLIVLNLYSQKESPFDDLNFIKILSDTNIKTYKLELNELRNNKLSELERIKKEILIASNFRDFKKVITLLKKQIEIEGESPDLLYQLGGTNGILAYKKKNFLSIIYLNEMMKSFSKSLELDPNHIPTLEAYIDALHNVPAIFGGDKNKAIKLAERLIKTSRLNGYLSMARLYFNSENKEMFNFHLDYFFKELSKLSICENENSKTLFFKNSNNFPIKISQITSYFEKEVDSGLCAVDFYLQGSNFKNNLYSLEWIYYLKSRLLLLNGNYDDSIRFMKVSLDINPDFELSRKFLKLYN